MTDLDNNQITAFHPGAMQSAHEIDVPARGDLALAIVAPDGREAMLRHAAQLAAAGVPFIFDPGQGLPMFDGAELRRFVEQASWVAVNDYEAEMLAERTGMTLEAMSRSHLRGIVVTLGADGCELWQDGERLRVPGVAAESVRRSRPAAATRFAPPCSTASSAAGRWNAAPRSATASARSRSPAAAGRIMCWIARSSRTETGARLKLAANSSEAADHGPPPSLRPRRRPRRRLRSPPGRAAAGSTGRSSRPRRSG